MQWKHLFLTLLVLFCFSEFGLTQQSKSIATQLEEGYEQAMNYKEVSLYGESIGELDNVIALAKKHNFQEQVIKASIAKAELFRKTENFNRGILLLYQLKDTEKYPKLHVQKLGRLAALYAEHGDFPNAAGRDTVELYTKEALRIAKQLNLKEEEAGLRNEIGFSQNRAKQFDVALENLNKSVRLYEEIGDQQNMIGVQINILDLHVSMSNYKKSDSIYPILVSRLENSDWYTMKSKLFAIISIRYLSTGDKFKELGWAEKAHQATVAHVRKINSNQMASFKVIHDTNKFKEEVLKKTVDLQRQKNKAERLLLFIAILVFIIALVILIFFREKRLKRKLNTSVGELNIMNDKYEMLIIESNHRIKNNLQMIISMLEFTKKGMKNSDTDIVQSMSGKIQTISALHKHLYVDIHNERVDLSGYFNEILRHYKDIGLHYEVHASISSAQIKSERIVYFGLILNEMLSNTLEHGKSDKLQILLKVEEHDGHFQFVYSDSSPHASDTTKGTGTMLIQQLVQRVKGTNFEMHHDTGTYQFEFTA